jgi:hypothetical protein
MDKNSRNPKMLEEESSTINIDDRIDTATFIEELRRGQQEWLSKHPEITIYEIDDIV